VREVAEGVWQLGTRMPNFISCYLAGGALFDAGTRRLGPRLLRELRGSDVTSVALTHVHPDHQGAAHLICSELNIPLACPALEVGRMDGSEPIPAPNLYLKVAGAMFTGPPHRVDRALKEGDEVAGFTVYETPGHSIGHVVYFRESDGVAIVGDVIDGLNIFTGIPGLNRPPDAVNERPELVNDAIRKLAELRPRIVCFGHGPVLRDPERLQRFAAGLS
jgi:hydroxyacylglutathione hydrolase